MNKRHRDDLYDDEDESEEDEKRTKKAKKIYGDDEDDLDYMDVEEAKSAKTYWGSLQSLLYLSLSSSFLVRKRPKKRRCRWSLKRLVKNRKVPSPF